MPYQFTLSDIRAAEELAEVSPVPVDGTRFRALINEVQRLYWRRGDWENSEWLTRFCVYDRCITWPNWMRAIRGARFCNMGTATVRNEWYAILGRQHGNCNFSCNVVMRDNGTAPCFNDIYNPLGEQVQYHVVKSQDIGKKITIYGEEYGGQPLQQRLDGGDWSMGMTISASNPDTRSASLVTKISSITREATQGVAYLYAYNPVTLTLRTLSQFDPNETNPRYQRSTVEGFNNTGNKDSYGRPTISVEVMSKLKFIEVVAENDFVMIDNVDAMKLGIQAVKAGESGDVNSREVFLDAGVKELNFDLRDKDRPENLTVSLRPVGRRIYSSY